MATESTLPLMPGQKTYSVTRGDETKQVNAANNREAVRRFENDKVRTEAALVKGDETIPGLLPSDGNSNPPKRRYRVTWGEEVREVTAVHRDDAWSQFVGNKTDTMEYKFPNLYERTIEDLGPVGDSSDSKSKAKSEGDDNGESPVANMTASEAKDHISRVHSADKLKAIAANDNRSTVAAAAQERLDSLENK